MKNYLIILLLFLFVGCSKEYNVDDLIINDSTQIEDIPFKIKIYNEKFSKDVVSGKVYQIYTNEKVLLGKVKNGKKEGLWTEWYDNGQKRAESTYKGGRDNGLATSWHENGQKRAEITYKNGEQDGLQTFWYENGQKKSEGIIKTYYARFHEHRPKRLEGFANLPLFEKEGLWTWWYENGRKWMKTTYKDGNGSDTYWYENGQKSNQTIRKDGETLHTFWHENGQKGSERTSKDGNLDGLWTKWYKSGQKRYESTHKDGKEISLKKWNEDGSVKD